MKDEQKPEYRNSQISAEKCIDTLIQYAALRQAGFESHQNQALRPNSDAHNSRTRDLIIGISEFYGFPSATDSHITRMNECLYDSQRSIGVEFPTRKEQCDMVRSLLNYAKDLSVDTHDMREQMLKVLTHFEDMTAFLPWDASGSGIYEARDWWEWVLPAATAQQNILFTRILLGPETGPCASGFVGGSATNPADVAATYLFDDMTSQYPEIETWPALCTVYRCGHELSAARAASELDLQIMRDYENTFMRQRGLSVCRYPTEIAVSRDLLQSAAEQQDQGMRHHAL